MTQGMQPVAAGLCVVPPKVAAAQDYLRFCECMRNPSSGFDGMKGEARDLGATEQKVYEAALEVLRLYFSGEQDFDSAPASSPTPPEDPQQRVPVTQ